MRDSYRVLTLGSSDVTYTETDESAAAYRLLEGELTRRYPRVAWQLEHGLLYPTATMAERAEHYIDRMGPHVLHLSMGANTFVEKTVLFSVRRRLPWLYPAASRLTRLGKAVAGGGGEGGAGFRGQIFRAPRLFGRAVFGMAPMLDPDAALEATVQTLAMLSRNSVPVVVRLAEGNVQQADQRQAAAASTGAYNAAVSELCRLYGFAVFQLSVELGAKYARTPDGLHADLPTRQYGAVRAADLIASALTLADPGED